MRRSLAAVLVISLTFPAASLRAEEAGVQGLPFSPGDRIRYRIHGAEGRRVGEVLELGPDSILVQSAGGPVRVPTASLDNLDVFRGRRSLAREGAIVGFVPGALFGAALGALAACMDQGNCSGAGGPVILGGFMGGAVTAGAGALVGLCFKKDRWERASPRRVRVALVPVRGGLAGSVTVALP